MYIISMLSGGLDSTYLLWHLLKNTTHHIHAHHLRYSYPDFVSDRCDIEQTATRAIVYWCRENIRDFEYSESFHELNGRKLNAHAWYAMQGVSMIHAGFGEVMATGRILSETTERGVEYINRSWQFFDLVSETAGAPNAKRTTKDGKPFKGHWVTPIIGKTKADIFAELPDELIDMTSSCWRPNYNYAGVVEICGECINCLRRKQAREYIAQGMSTEEINDLICRTPVNDSSPSGPVHQPKWKPWPNDFEEMERTS